MAVASEDVLGIWCTHRVSITGRKLLHRLESFLTRCEWREAYLCLEMDMPGLPVSQRHILSLKPDKDKAEVEETPAPNNSLESTHRETTKSVGHDRTLFRKEYIDRLFMCPVCGGVLNDPMVLLDCGHHFCRECILKTPSR